MADDFTADKVFGHTGAVQCCNAGPLKSTSTIGACPSSTPIVLAARLHEGGLSMLDDEAQPHLRYLWICLHDLLSLVDDPQPEFASREACNTFEVEIERNSHRALHEGNSPDVATVGAIRAARFSGLEFLRILKGNPSLWATPVTEWTSTRHRELYEELSASIRRLESVIGKPMPIEPTPTIPVVQPGNFNSPATLNDEEPPDDSKHIVTTGQIAALVRCANKTITRWLEKEPLILPHREGGGGLATLWNWQHVRGRIVEQSRRDFPEQFPSLT